jgi:hypothetical protein
MGSVVFALGVPVTHIFLRAFTPLRARWTYLLTLGAALGILGLSDSVGSGGDFDIPQRPHLSAPKAYHATIYVAEDVGGPNGDHHEGVDQLLACMGSGNSRFYKSETPGPESGPDGIVGADDVVLIKISSQWDQTGGTNTDVLKGVIARVLEHPDGFSGEIVIGENTQTWGSLDWEDSNAEDHGQSTMDVVNYFAGLGHPVSAYLWDDIRTASVAEYDTGDMVDGYVVLPREPYFRCKVSYPKFQTAGGAYISLMHGIWDPAQETYDDSRFTFINLPILKCHGYQYGVTACCKHHVGTMTTAISTYCHDGVYYGICGSFLGKVRMPDLNILDCIYVLAHPDAGPWCTYEESTRLDHLVAGWDPVAIDIWATVNILVPAIEANGYTSYPMQDPDDPSSIFRQYLDNSMTEMLALGITVTNDLSQITAFTCGSTSVEPDAVGSEIAVTVRVCPNPLTSGTTIQLDLPVSQTVEASIYDVKGRRLRTMREVVPAGQGQGIYWDGRNQNGVAVAPGTYYYRLTGLERPVTGKMTVVR